MRIYLSSDMEGTAGIVDWAQCVGPGPLYEEGRELLLAEVNAAIDGAVAAGASEIVVNDSHSTMHNLPPTRLHARAEYLSGQAKPLYMMEGLDASFDAAFFISYHASAGTAGVLSHTYNPAAFARVELNGTVAGESGLGALVAQAHGVPVVLITGDQFVGPEAEPFCAGIETVQVKHSVSRTAARSLHPEEARLQIRAGAERAVRRVAAGEFRPPSIDLPATLRIEFRTDEMAGALDVLGDRVERTGPRTVAVTDDQPLRLFRTFLAVNTLTRPLALVR
jgi:D-amino peptidase